MYAIRFALRMLFLGFAVTLALPAAAAPGCNASLRKCIVEISLDGSGKVIFDPDELHIRENQIGKKYCIVFKLLPPGSSYNPAEGDGVVFKDPTNGEFYESGVSNGNSCTHTTNTGASRYWWKFRNSSKGMYHYKAQFRDSTGKVYTGDPTITNIDGQ